MKGLLLAGGLGSRLHPATVSVSKHILPIYDKPMIYYSLSTLMLAGIREILIVTDAQQYEFFTRLLGDGDWLGLNLSYSKQEHPGGVAEGILIGADYLKDDPFCLSLGDNFFYGAGFGEVLKAARVSVEKEQGATIFALHVSNTDGLGVIEFGANNRIVDIKEKPEQPKSNFIVPGLYFYDSAAVNLVKNISPSLRGELEISDLNKIYLEKNKLRAKKLGRGFAWFDMGTVDAMLEASNFVHTVQSRQGILIGSLEEIAFNQGWISRNNLNDILQRNTKSAYYKTLQMVQDAY